MTISAVAEVISTNNSTTSESKPMHCPKTASEAYNLGIEMEKVLTGIYTELEKKCNSPSAKKILITVLTQNRQDIATFYEAFGFALNCEIGRFYQSKGKVVSYDSIEQQIASTKPLIIRNLENFFRKNEEIQKDIFQEGSNLGEYFNTRNSTDVYEVCMKVRANSSELYARLAKLYPAGEIRAAFEEMVQIINEGSSEISRKV